MTTPARGTRSRATTSTRKTRMNQQRIAKAMAALGGYKLRKIAQNTTNGTVRAAAIAEIERRKA